MSTKRRNRGSATAVGQAKSKGEAMHSRGETVAMSRRRGYAQMRKPPLDEMTSLHGVFCKYLSKKPMDFLKNRAIITHWKREKPKEVL